MSWYPENILRSHDGPRTVMKRGPGPLPIHPAALEEELEMQHREIRRIISENRLVIDDNTLLQRELAAAKDEIHRLGQVIPKLQAEKEAQAMELIERGLKLEADLRASEPLRVEVMQLRAEVQKLNALRQDLSTKIQRLTQDNTRVQAENQQLTSMRGDVNHMRKDLLEARFGMELLIQSVFLSTSYPPFLLSLLVNRLLGAEARFGMEFPIQTVFASTSYPLGMFVF